MSTGWYRPSQRLTMPEAARFLGFVDDNDNVGLVVGDFCHDVRRSLPRVVACRVQVVILTLFDPLLCRVLVDDVEHVQRRVGVSREVEPRRDHPFGNWPSIYRCKHCHGPNSMGRL